MQMENHVMVSNSQSTSLNLLHLGVIDTIYRRDMENTFNTKKAVGEYICLFRWSGFKWGCGSEQ